MVEATPTSLKGRAFTTNNIAIDEFELKKFGGRPAVSYLAKVHSEALLNLAFDAAPSLTAELASMPGVDSAAQVIFTIRPLGKDQQPVELEIGLTPASATRYELTGGPLHITAPSTTQSNKVVWATVQARGQQNVEAAGARSELSPALVFQARVRTGTAETVAYGQKSKVSASAAAAAKF
jgi:hypothetical protein